MEGLAADDPLKTLDYVNRNFKSCKSKHCYIKVPLSLIFLLRKSLQISALTCRKQKFFQSRARLLSYEA